MRLWSLHPRYLDRLGLVAVWREGLLAQKVLAGKTRGYQNHPQLERFRESENPPEAIAQYLLGVWREACRRGYCFSGEKIGPTGQDIFLQVSRGQLEFELQWLGEKLKKRDFRARQKLPPAERIDSHPLFRVVPGEIASWEKGKLTD